MNTNKLRLNCFTKVSTPADCDLANTVYPFASRSVSMRSFQRECGTRHAGSVLARIAWSDALIESKIPKIFSLRGRRLTPSRCSTAACAARQDQIADDVYRAAQSIVLVSGGQNGSSDSTAALGWAPVTINPSSSPAHKSSNRP